MLLKMSGRKGNARRMKEKSGTRAQEVGHRRQENPLGIGWRIGKTCHPISPILFHSYSLRRSGAAAPVNIRQRQRRN